MSKYASAHEAVKIVKSGDRVYVHAAAATSNLLTKALTDRASELMNVEVCHMHTEGDAPYANLNLRERFHVNSFFVGKNVRHTLEAGNGLYTPVFLSELPRLFRKKVVPLDVVFIQVSPPDSHGFCSLGVSVEATLAAIQNANHVIALVNPKMPRTFGDRVIPIARIDFLVENGSPLYCQKMNEISEQEAAIGRHVASLVEDGSTLQLGIGSIPNAALANRTNRKNLGLHTEMFSDGVIELIQNGTIDCSRKGVVKGRALATFLIGSQKLYDFVNDNPFIEMRESSFVNDTAVIRRNPKMVAIHSAIEVDVTGQVCADSIGSKMYPGVGGQMDFIRGVTQ